MTWSPIPILAATDPFDKPVYDIVKGDLEYLKGDSGWTAVSYTNSWVDADATVGSTHPVGAQFKRVGDFTIIRGSMKNGTSNASAFTLPVGYRPSTPHYFLCLGGAGAAGYYCGVLADGTVVPTAPSNASFGFGVIWVPLL